MYEIVMSNGDRAECDTVAACLVTVATLAEDSGWTSKVEEAFTPQGKDIGLAWVLHRHLNEVRP